MDNSDCNEKSENVPCAFWPPELWIHVFPPGLFSQSTETTETFTYDYPLDILTQKDVRRFFVKFTSPPFSSTVSSLCWMNFEICKHFVNDKRLYGECIRNPLTGEAIACAFVHPLIRSICGVYVAPVYRGCGFAERVIESLAMTLLAHGLPPYCLVMPSDYATKSILTRMGWKSITNKQPATSDPQSNNKQQTYQQNQPTYNIPAKPTTVQSIN